MVLSIGEYLADLIGKLDSNKNMLYSRNPGGAPFNVIYQINKMGYKCGFIASVGDDIIGHYLYNYAKTLNFDYLDVSIDSKHNTTLAFVDNDEFGERHFKFNRFNTSDYYIDYNRLDVIKFYNIIHIGSLMLREEIGRKLFDEIVDKAKSYNKLISFDVNFRSDIYNSELEAINIYRKCIEVADIVKLSLEEIELFANTKDYKKAISTLCNYNQVVVVSLGSKGSYLRYKDIEIEVPSISVDVVDTTGAGDCFYGTFLGLLDELGLENLSEEEAKKILYKANINGAKACTYYGAISMVTQEI